MQNATPTINSSVVFASAADMQERARREHNQMSRWTFRHVENPIGIDDVRASVVRLRSSFASFAEKNLGKSDKELCREYLRAVQDQAKGGDETAKGEVRFITDTHPTIARCLMRRVVPEQEFAVLMNMIGVKTKELDPEVSEEEKDRVVGEMQNTIFNMCLKDKA